jgi:hypothetical protein
MSGSGTYSWQISSGVDEVFSAGGSSGSDYAGLSQIDTAVDLAEPFGGLPTFLAPEKPRYWSGGVGIDGISGFGYGSMLGGNTADWCLGDGCGSTSIFDSGNNLLATATLIGYVQYTNVTEMFIGGTLVQVTASFTISPTPEPRSWVLLGLGLAVLAGGAFTHRCSINALRSTRVGAGSGQPRPGAGLG